jgi:hypothetical protein
LNDPFVHSQAERFAERVRKAVGADPSAQVRHAFRLAFQRQPTAGESAGALELVQKHGLAVLCRLLFNANEFVVAD